MEVQKWREMLVPYEQAVKELEVKFESVMNEYHQLGKHSPIESVKGRVKRIASILDKAKNKGIPLSRIEDEIEDISGVRIICQFVEDISKVVELIRRREDMVIKTEKDYVTNMKESGYRSYHVVVRYDVNTIGGVKTILAEIQIRTLAMNFWATIEHSLQYKYEHNMPAKIRERLLIASEAAGRLDHEMSKIREEIIDVAQSYQHKSNLIADILSNIQNIKKVIGDTGEVEQIQEEFYELWEEGDVFKLETFNKRLDMKAAKYKVQRL